MTLSAGTVFLDVLPNTTKFAAGVNSGVQKDTGKLKSTMGKLASGVGLAIGLTAGISFMKGAISNAEEAAKSQNLFTSALEKTHQAGLLNAESFNTWLSDFALGIGKDDDELRNLSTHLVNAFDFSKFGANATTALEQMTQTIIDMSVATGKPQKALEKMFLTIGNDPAGALVQLTKLGVITQDQADHFEAMTEAGYGAEVSQKLLTLASLKYEGTAKKGTTASERMGAVFGEISETVGSALLPVMGFLSNNLSKVFEWVKGLSPGTKHLAAMIGGSLVTALVAWKVAQIAVNIATMANPIGLVVAAVAVGAMLIITHWKTVKTFVGHLWDGVVGVFNGVANGVIGAIEFVVNAAISGINRIHDAMAFLNPIGGAGWDRLESVSFGRLGGGTAGSSGGGSASVHQFATGGIVTRPTLSLIGEAGPEAVVPLSGGMHITITDSNLGMVLRGVIDEDRDHAARQVRSMR